MQMVRLGRPHTCLCALNSHHGRSDLSGGGERRRVLAWLPNFVTSFTSLIISVRIRTMKKQNTAAAFNTVTATKAKASFSAVLARAGYQGQRIIIKKGARPTAVILGYEDFQRLVDLEDRFESAVLTKSLEEDRFLSFAGITKRLRL